MKYKYALSVILEQYFINLNIKSESFNSGEYYLIPEGNSQWQKVQLQGSKLRLNSTGSAL